MEKLLERMTTNFSKSITNYSKPYDSWDDWIDAYWGRYNLHFQFAFSISRRPPLPLSKGVLCPPINMGFPTAFYTLVVNSLHRHIQFTLQSRLSKELPG